MVNLICAQDFSKVDNKIKLYPTSFVSVAAIASKIDTDFKTKEEKVRAIFTWIAFNIKYDLVAYKNQSVTSRVAFSYRTEEEKTAKLLKFRQEMALKTLKSKKGVCQDYAALFHTICDLIQVDCVDITGTSKTHPTQIGVLPEASDHMWNAIKVQGKWQLIDVTWASGSVDINTGKFVSKFNDGYFFTQPTVFFLNHFPDDERYLMTRKTKEDFAALPLYYGNYIASDYEIVTPEKGMLSDSKSNKINFKIIDLPKNDLVSYAISSERGFVPVVLKRGSNYSEFDITISKEAKGYLTLFVNNKSIVTYKI